MAIEMIVANAHNDQWREVVAQSGAALQHRRGRYYYKTVVSERLRQVQNLKRTIQHTVRHLIRQYKKTKSETDRRQQGRCDFVQPVKVRLEDQREFTLLSRDLSENGIRLIGTRSFLGQKVQVHVPRPDGSQPIVFLVRILWTCTVGDGLLENGGTFLELIEL